MFLLCKYQIFPVYDVNKLKIGFDYVKNRSHDFSIIFKKKFLVIHLFFFCLNMISETYQVKPIQTQMIEFTLILSSKLFNNIYSVNKEWFNKLHVTYSKSSVYTRFDFFSIEV